jgi:type VI protein secretion system component Hcp
MADRRRRRLTLAAASVAGVLAMGGLAVAAHKSRTIPIGPDGTITACAKEGNGKLRMVAAATSCDKHEQVVTWNQKGPKGDPGPKGEPGPQGPPGAAAPEPGDVVAGLLTIGAHAAVPIHAFSFDVTNATTIGGPGGGAGAGKAKVADVELVKDIDDLTLSILDDVFRGERETTVTVVLYDPGATTTRATFTFTNVFLTESGQTGGDDLEHVKFVFQKFEEKIGTSTFRWDVAQNKAG